MKSKDIIIGQKYSIKGKYTATVVAQLPNGLFELDNGEVEFARHITMPLSPWPTRQPEGIRNEFRSGTIIHSATHGISHGLGGLRSLRGLIGIILQEEGWRDFVVQSTKERCCFGSFEEWVQAPIPYGLESDVATIRLLCRLDVKHGSHLGERHGLSIGDDNEVTAMIDRACSTP